MANFSGKTPGIFPIPGNYREYYNFVKICILIQYLIPLIVANDSSQIFYTQNNYCRKVQPISDVQVTFGFHRVLNVLKLYTKGSVVSVKCE